MFISMSIRVFVILFAILFGLASAAKLKAPKKECVDNTLYAKYLCIERKDGEKFLVPGKCGEYYECSKNVSTKKSCPKFFDPVKKICVLESDCVEVDDTSCVIPTPPPCSGNPTPTPEPCECPAPPTTPPPEECPIVTCPTAKPCPSVPTCPAPTECPEPPTCPTLEPPTDPTPTEPSPKPPCPPPSGGPCGNWFDPNDLYGSFVCRGKSDGTMLIVPQKCSEYYYCIGGHSYRKDCGKDRYFNPKVNACDEKSSVYCPSEKKQQL